MRAVGGKDERITTCAVVGTDTAGWVTDSTRSDNVVEFLGDLVKLTPKHLDLHWIAYNLSAQPKSRHRSFNCGMSLSDSKRRPGRSSLLIERASRWRQPSLSSYSALR